MKRGGWEEKESREDFRGKRRRMKKSNKWTKDKETWGKRKEG